MSRATLGKDPAEVAAMFDEVAQRYDVTNDVLSAAGPAAGVRPRWRRWTRSPVSGCWTSPPAPAPPPSRWPPPGRWQCRATSPSACCGRVGSACRPCPSSPATRCLPFADATFDAVTISFGLRNLVDPLSGLAELRRVTRPGGRLVICEFSTPTNTPVRVAYLEYLMRALPEVARRVSSNPEAYVYLAESIRAWPDQPGLADDRRRRVVRGAVAQPDRRDRGAASRFRARAGGGPERQDACRESATKPRAPRRLRHYAGAR